MKKVHSPLHKMILVPLYRCEVLCHLYVVLALKGAMSYWLIGYSCW